MKMVKLLFVAIVVANLSNLGFGQTYNIPSASGTSSTYLGAATGDLNLTSIAGNIYLKTPGTVTSPSIGINTEGNVGIGILPSVTPTSGYFTYPPALQVQGLSGNNAVPFVLPRAILSLTSSTPGCNGAYQFGIQTNNRPFIIASALDLMGSNLNVAAPSASLTLGTSGDKIASESSGASKLSGTLSIGAGSGSFPTIPSGYGLAVTGGIVTDKMIIGNVTTNSNYKLFVEQGVLTEKVRVAVKTTGNWSDFVFDKEYKLLSLSEVETYIKKNKHLPDVPSADQVVKDGIDMATMDAKLLQKIEELTLYMIEMKKENEKLKERVQVLESK